MVQVSLVCIPSLPVWAACEYCQGHTAEIRALLQKYGASKLSQIDPAHYKALLAEAEVLTNGS